MGIVHYIPAPEHIVLENDLLSIENHLITVISSYMSSLQDGLHKAGFIDRGSGLLDPFPSDLRINAAAGNYENVALG